MNTAPDFIDGPNGRIAFRQRHGAGPGIVWLGGFRSDMLGTKAEFLDQWAKDQGARIFAFRLFRPWRIERQIRRRMHWGVGTRRRICIRRTNQRAANSGGVVYGRLDCDIVGQATGRGILPAWFALHPLLTSQNC